MNDQRQTSVSGQVKLPPKHFHLHVARRVVVVKVESNFTPGYDARALFKKTGDSLFSFAVKEAGVVRVGANCGVDIFVLLGQLNGALQRAAMGIAGADIQNGGNACIARTLNNLLAVRVKLRTVYVCMRIDEHLSREVNIFS